MNLLIFPKPVLDNNMTVNSYCFRFQKAGKYLENQPLWLLDGAMNSPCLDVLKMVDLDGFTNGLPIFVPISKYTLISDVENQCSVDHEKMIFLLDGKTLPDELYLKNINRLKGLGYRFALENVFDYESMSPILDLIDFIFINSEIGDFKEIVNTLKRKYKNLSYIASNVDNMDNYGRLKYTSINCFEGKFYRKPSLKGHNTIAPIKVNRIQLLNIVGNAEFDIERVTKVVEQDPSLSISLLRFVNSPYLRVAQKIKTIQHAVAMLGQTEVRKWVTTAASGALGDDKPAEITRLSLMRAKFAENLSKYFGMEEESSSLFLMGLFSILDVVLEMPMVEALNIVIVSDKIQEALAHRQGEFAIILDFIYAYEVADWREVNRLMVIYGVNSEDVFNSYIEAARWYSTIARSDKNVKTE